jgi:hypothetical protein
VSEAADLDLFRTLAQQDVPCPACGYNLRGLLRPRCPECGAEINPRLLTRSRREPSARLYRVLEAVVLIGAILSIFLLSFRAARAIGAHDPLKIVAAIALPLIWLAVVVFWTRSRPRLARTPAHQQARIASAAAAALLVFCLVAMAAGVI